MYLFLLERRVDGHKDRAVVVAESGEKARLLPVSGMACDTRGEWRAFEKDKRSVTVLGTAEPALLPGVIMVEFIE